MQNCVRESRRQSVRPYPYFLDKGFPQNGINRRTEGGKSGNHAEAPEFSKITVIISLKRGDFRPKQVEGTIYRVRGKNGKITLKNVMGEWDSTQAEYNCRLLAGML